MLFGERTGVHFTPRPGPARPGPAPGGADRGHLGGWGRTSWHTSTVPPVANTGGANSQISRTVRPTYSRHMRFKLYLSLHLLRGCTPLFCDILHPPVNIGAKVRKLALTLTDAKVGISSLACGVTPMLSNHMRFLLRSIGCNWFLQKAACLADTPSGV